LTAAEVILTKDRGGEIMADGPEKKGRREDAVPQREAAHREPPHAHLRNLSYGEQVKVARGGNQQDRTALERIYGKAVWEPLLQNPGITVGEVSRIAQKGALPKNLIELIVANGSWLKNNVVRRGLLQNHRLGRNLIVKVLRAMPKHELRVVEKQSIYSSVVRELAKKMAAGSA
jgi:hypothetical protein